MILEKTSLALALMGFTASVGSAFQFPVAMRADVPVEVESGFFSSKYRQEGKLLQPLSVYGMMEKYPEAKAELGAAKPLLYTGMIFGFAGGFMMGHPLGTSLAGGDFNMPLFLSGAGLAGVGLFLGRMSDRRLARGVKAYNAALPPGLGFEGGWLPHGGRLGVRMAF